MHAERHDLGTGIALGASLDSLSVAMARPVSCAASRAQPVPVVTAPAAQDAPPSGPGHSPHVPSPRMGQAQSQVQSAGTPPGARTAGAGAPPVLAHVRFQADHAVLDMLRTGAPSQVWPWPGASMAPALSISLAPLRFDCTGAVMAWLARFERDRQTLMPIPPAAPPMSHHGPPPPPQPMPPQTQGSSPGDDDGRRDRALRHAASLPGMARLPGLWLVLLHTVVRCSTGHVDVVLSTADTDTPHRSIHVRLPRIAVWPSHRTALAWLDSPLPLRAPMAAPTLPWSVHLSDLAVTARDERSTSTVLLVCPFVDVVLVDGTEPSSPPRQRATAAPHVVSICVHATVRPVTLALSTRAAAVVRHVLSVLQPPQQGERDPHDASPSVRGRGDNISDAGSGSIPRQPRSGDSDPQLGLADAFERPAVAHLQPSPPSLPWLNAAQPSTPADLVARRAVHATFWLQCTVSSVQITAEDDEGSGQAHAGVRRRIVGQLEEISGTVDVSPSATRVQVKLAEAHVTHERWAEAWIPGEAGGTLLERSHVAPTHDMLGVDDHLAVGASEGPVVTVALVVDRGTARRCVQIAVQPLDMVLPAAVLGAAGAILASIASTQAWAGRHTSSSRLPLALPAILERPPVAVALTVSVNMGRVRLFLLPMHHLASAHSLAALVVEVRGLTVAPDSQPRPLPPSTTHPAPGGVGRASEGSDGDRAEAWSQSLQSLDGHGLRDMTIRVCMADVSLRVGSLARLLSRGRVERGIAELDSPATVWNASAPRADSDADDDDAGAGVVLVPATFLGAITVRDSDDGAREMGIEASTKLPVQLRANAAVVSLVAALAHDMTGQRMPVPMDAVVPADAARHARGGGADAAALTILVSVPQGEILLLRDSTVSKTIGPRRTDSVLVSLSLTQPLVDVKLGAGVVAAGVSWSGMAITGSESAAHDAFSVLHVASAHMPAPDGTPTFFVLQRRSVAGEERLDVQVNRAVTLRLVPPWITECLHWARHVRSMATGLHRGPHSLVSDAHVTRTAPMQGGRSRAVVTPSRDQISEAAGDQTADAVPRAGVAGRVDLQWRVVTKGILFDAGQQGAAGVLAVEAASVEVVSSHETRVSSDGSRVRHDSLAVDIGGLGASVDAHAGGGRLRLLDHTDMDVRIDTTTPSTEVAQGDTGMVAGEKLSARNPGLVGSAGDGRRAGAFVIETVTTTITARSDLLRISAGPAHVACVVQLAQALRPTLRALTSLIARPRRRWEDAQQDAEPEPVVRQPESLLSHDDLRSAAVVYRFNAPADASPRAGEAVFAGASASALASVTWKYPAPRCLTRLGATPVPLAMGDEDGSGAGDGMACALLALDRSTGAFVSVATFHVSTEAQVELSLPATAAEVWRVEVLRAPASVTPELLGGCLRIDSRAVTETSVSVAVDRIEAALLNQPRRCCGEGPSLGFDGATPLVAVELGDARASASLCDARLVHSTVTATVSATMHDWADLTLVPLLPATDLAVRAVAGCTARAPVKVHVDVGHVALLLDPSTVRVLAASAASWQHIVSHMSQGGTTPRDTAATAACAKLPELAHLVIDNTTTAPLLAQEVDGTRALTVLPACRRPLLSHARRGCRATNAGTAVRFRGAESPNAWCEPVDVTLATATGGMGYARRHVVVGDMAAAMWVALARSDGVQTCITVTGLLALDNRCVPSLLAVSQCGVTTAMSGTGDGCRELGCGSGSWWQKERPG